MPKKVTEILSNLFSTNKSGGSSSTSRVEKLVTDAAPLDNMYEQSLSKSDSKVPESSTAATSPSTSTSSTGGAVVGNELQPTNAPAAGNVVALRPEKYVEPHELPALDIVLPSSNTSVAARSDAPLMPVNVNNTQGYNVYQFSQISGLHIGSVYNISQSSQPDVVEQPQQQQQQLALESASAMPYKKTKSIDAMMRCSEPLQHRHMDIVSTHLGEGWRDVIRLLGFSEGQIEQLYEDNYARGIKEVIYGFLLDYSRNDEQATVGHLARLLWRTGRRECVVKLKDYWKGTRRDGSVCAKMEADNKQTDESLS